MTRYKVESEELFNLCLKQLNSPKNRKKEKFENMRLIDILEKLREEIFELKHELAYEIEAINTRRVKEELGDCVAMLVGVLCYTNKIMKEKS